MLAKKEITNSFIYSAESIFSGICSILFYILIANYLNLEDIGAYSLAIVYASIIGSMATFGLVSGYERTYFEFVNSFEEKGSLITSLQFFAAISIIIFVSIGLFFSYHIVPFLFGDDKYSNLWIWILIGINISEFTKFYLTFLRNSQQAYIFSYLHMVQVITNFLLAYIFLVILEKEVQWLGISLLISYICMLILSFLHQLKNLPTIVDINIFKTVARISLPLTPRVFIGFIGTQFDKIIISQVSSLASLGIYSVAQRLALSTYMLMNAFGKVWQPRLYEDLFKSGSKTDTSYMLTYMAISFLPSLFLLLFSKEIFMLFPENYSSGYKILIVICLYYLILFMGKITGQQLLFAKKTWLISGLSLLTIILNIVITYPLVVKFGAFGAACGTFIAALIMGLISFYFAQKHAYLKWDFKKIYFCYLYLFMASIFSLFSLEHIFNYGILLIIKILFLINFIYFSQKLGILNFKDIIKQLVIKN